MLARANGSLEAKIALASAYLADGQKKRAAGIARTIWIEEFLDQKSEARVLDKLGSLLTQEDHWNRAMHLMMHDRATGTERLYKFMTPAQKSLAVARNAVSRNAKDAKSLLDAGLDLGHVAVNLSARQFRDRRLVARMRDILERTGLAPGRLELEITESLVMHDVESVIGKLKELKALGILLAIDDFGTGYSSLSYLRRFPIDRIKIDQSFTREVDTSSDAAAIARAVIQLGHALGLIVIAEGVETQEQLVFLKGLGCDYGQGFLFSRPLSAPEVNVFLAEHRAASAALAAAN